MNEWMSQSGLLLRYRYRLEYSKVAAEGFSVGFDFVIIGLKLWILFFLFPDWIIMIYGAVFLLLLLLSFIWTVWISIFKVPAFLVQMQSILGKLGNNVQCFLPGCAVSLKRHKLHLCNTNAKHFIVLLFLLCSTILLSGASAQERAR